MNDRAILEAFARGQQANRAGRPISTCPHRPSETIRWDAWIAGWWDEEGPKYVVASK
jgi:ribosome modulation factor